MSTEDEAVTARPLHDRAREVRVIRALYPRECLNHSKEPLNSTSTAALAAVPRTYHNTGVQTLPPANGDVFRLIYGLDGRELSHNDYAQSMASAGIGRLANDPRMNPYELIYGSAYHAPTTAKKETYADSGFQTASHETRRKALARAKVKTSMMANKYRNAAFEAGYAIYAESRDEMIVHSERFSSAVQLDAEGNLLEGDIKSKSLPNIHGATIHSEPSEAAVTRKVSVQQMESIVKQPCYIEHGVQTSHAPYQSPLHTPLAPSQALTAELQKAATVSALAPAAVEQTPSATSVIDNEYGSGEPATDDFVVYNAGAENNGLKVARGSTNTSQTKRKASEGDTDDQSSKKLKPSAQASPQSPPVSLVPLAVTPPNRPDQNRSNLPLPPDSDLKPPPAPSKTCSMQPEDSSQDHTLKVVETGTPSRSMFQSNLSTSTDTSRVRWLNSRRKMLRSPRVDDKCTVTNADLNSPSKAKDDSHLVNALNKPESARLEEGAFEPTVPLAVAETKIRGLGVKAAGPASRRSKRVFQEIGAEPVDDEQDTKGARKTIGRHHHRKGSLDQVSGPSDKPYDSTDRGVATETHLQAPASGVAKGTNRTASGSVKKTAVSRTSHTARKPMAPYVPPAKRLRDHNKLEFERKERQ